MCGDACLPTCLVDCLIHNSMLLSLGDIRGCRPDSIMVHRPLQGTVSASRVQAQCSPHRLSRRNHCPAHRRFPAQEIPLLCIPPPKARWGIPGILFHTHRHQSRTPLSARYCSCSLHHKGRHSHCQSHHSLAPHYRCLPCMDCLPVHHHRSRHDSRPWLSICGCISARSHPGQILHQLHHRSRCPHHRRPHLRGRSRRCILPPSALSHRRDYGLSGILQCLCRILWSGPAHIPLLHMRLQFRQHLSPADPGWTARYSCHRLSDRHIYQYTAPLSPRHCQYLPCCRSIPRQMTRGHCRQRIPWMKRRGAMPHLLCQHSGSKYHPARKEGQLYLNRQLRSRLSQQLMHA